MAVLFVVKAGNGEKLGRLVKVGLILSVGDEKGGGESNKNFA